MTLSAHVLIIGGGPAGSTAARILAEQRREVILIERDPAHSKPCGGGIAANALAEFGIPPRVVRREVDTIRLVSPSGKQVDIPLDGHRLAIVDRREFDGALRARAAERGATILEADFLSLECGTLNRSTVSIGGSLREIVSEFVIAADGVNSRARTSMGIPPVRSLYTASAILPARSADHCEFWFGSSHAPRSYSWVFPTGEGCSVGTGAREPRDVALLLEKFLERKGLPPPAKRRMYRIPVWSGDLYNIRHVLFAGDSAGQVLPMTYEGIYYAMKAGELAAEAIREGKVENYQKRWKARFGKRFTLMEKLGQFFLKDDASAEKLVELHARPDVQSASLRLWIGKDTRQRSLREYVSLFRKFL